MALTPQGLRAHGAPPPRQLPSLGTRMLPRDPATLRLVRAAGTIQAGAAPRRAGPFCGGVTLPPLRRPAERSGKEMMDPRGCGFGSGSSSSSVRSHQSIFH
jgi:hypothetical protein